MKQRFLSAILALAMLLALMPAAAFAAENEDGADDSEIVYETHPGIGSIEDILPLSRPFGITGTAYTGSYYDQLDSNSKTLYDAIYGSDLKNGPTKALVEFNPIPYSNDEERLDILWAAIAALLFDHPELSWLVNTEFTTGSSDNGLVRFGLSEKGYQCATTAPTGLVTPENHLYADTGNREDITKAIANAKAEIGDISQKSDYEKVKALYDWVCNNMEYAHYRTEDPNYSPSEEAKFKNHWRGYQTAYSALVEKVTVCAGYAKSFKLLCDEYNIPCAIITGRSNNQNHAWNYVQVGGSWYAIDCTWADQITYISYDYLLKGKTNFTDHTEGTLYSEYAFAYPVLSTEDYKDPSAPTDISITYTPTHTATSNGGIPGFAVPEIQQLGTTAENTITLTAALTGGTNQTVEWGLGIHDSGITLTPGENNTAKLTIQNSAAKDRNPNSPTGLTGPVATVTARCSTASKELELWIYVGYRTPKFVQILKNDSAITSDNIAQSGTASYTAKVYDQYGQELSGQTVNWSVTGGTGVSVSNGVVTVAPDAAAGDYTVTATSDSASASVTVTVTADTPAHTHSWSTDWDKNNTHHWHNCTVAGCDVTNDSQKNGYAEHIWVEGEVTPATCTQPGEKTYTCSTCQQTKIEVIEKTDHQWSTTLEKNETDHWAKCEKCSEIKDKAAHSFDSGKITDEPTYDDPGVRTYTCTACKYQKTEAIPKLEHSYSSTWSSDENTHWYACTDAGYETLKKDEAAHTWNEGVETTKPTYAAPGEKTFTCTFCGRTKTEAIDKLEHTYSSEWSKDNDYHWHACTDEGFEHLKKDEAVHTWDGGVETTPPSADTDGVKTYTCTACKQTKTETIGATGHTYSTDWSQSDTEHWHACTEHTDCDKVSGKATHTWEIEVTLEPTYDATGTRTLTCTECDYSKTEDIPKKEHIFSPLWSSDADQHWHACTEENCGEKDSLAEHEWDDGTITTPPTEESTGLKTYTCGVCHSTKQETIAQLGHNFSTEWSKDATHHWHACTDEGCQAVSGRAEHSWDSGVVTTEPTASSAGVKTFTCTVCRQTRTEPADPSAPDHTHVWAETWSTSGTHHWHSCTAAGCTITDNSQKNGYAPHVYENALAAACNVCGYVRTTTPEAGFTITFDANGGTVSPLSQVTGTDGKLLSLPTPVRRGYTFNGWRTSATGGALVTASTVFSADTTVYAWWTYNSSGSGSTHDDDSGSGGSSSPTIKIPVSGDNNSVQVSAAVSGTTASVSKLDTDQLNTVAGNGGRAGMVEVDLSGLNRTIQTVKLPGDTIREIAKAAADESNGTRGLTIKLSTGEASFDAAALDEIQRQAGNQISLTIAPASSSALNERQKDMVGNAPVYDLTMKTGSKAITDFGGGYLSVSLPYKLEQGQNPAGIVVYYLDNSGNIHACETMYDVRTETVIFTTGHLSLYFVGYDQTKTPAAPEEALTNPFTDVLPGAYYYDAVIWAAANGITEGTTATTFSPDSDCTRAQMAAFLWKAAGSPEPQHTECRFTDVQSDAYYYKAVLWAAEQGITAGTSETEFSPDAVVTRAQTVTFLYRAAGSPAAEGGSPFADVLPDAYYAAAVQWAVAEGITVGTGAAAFSPDSSCTRAQIAAFLYRSQTD